MPTDPPPFRALPTTRRSTARDIALNPAARVLWRAHDAIQLELGDLAYIVTGVDSGLVAELTGRTESTTGSRVPTELARALAKHRLAWRRVPTRAALPAGSSGPPVARLASELTSLTARLGRTALATMHARRERCVAIDGTSRTGVQAAAVLAAAGVGRVYLNAPGEATLHQVGPGALDAGDEGTILAEAGAAAINRAAPDVDTTPLPADRSPDLVLLAVDSPVPSDARDALHALRQPYLCARVDAGCGVVGPLVLPGESSCLRCADLHRQDRDPAWAALAVQLTLTPRHGVPSEIAVTTTVAGLTAMQALEFLDGGLPATVDGTLELHLPDWRVRRRSWPIHPDCGCSRV